MPPITVDPEVLSGAGASVGSVGDELAAAVTALAGGLPDGAMAGHDRAGLAFGRAYQQAGQALMDAGAAAASAGRTVGFGVQTSATNYSRADAASTIGGGATPLTAPTAPGGVEAPAVPSPFGGGVAEPLLWSMVQMLVGDVWPNGDPAQLRAAGGAWSAFARTVAGIGGQLHGPAATISGQQIPEGPAMAKALSELTKGLSDIASESAKLGVQVLEFATDVESAQDAIRDLLSRLSPAGIVDGIGAIFSGDALAELKEIAADIRTVLDNLGRQADARQQSMQDVMGLIDDAVVSLQDKARKEFTDFLGEDVGNAAATVLDIQTNVAEAPVKLGLETLASLQNLNPARFAHDFEGAKETWGGVADTLKYANPIGIALDPMGAFEHGKQQFEGLAHVDDWSTDRPGLGPAMVLSEIGSALIPGGAATRGTRAAGEAADIPDTGPGVRAASTVDNTITNTAAIAERAGTIGDNLDNLGNNIPTGPTPNATGLAIPRDLAEPPAPRVAEAPTPTPRAPDAPTPHVPDAPSRHTPESPTTGDRAAASPHNSTPTAAPHAPDAPVSTATPHASDPAPSVDRTPIASYSPMPEGTPAHTPAADMPAGDTHSAPTLSPTQAMAGNALEPAQLGAHATPAPPYGATSTLPEATPQDGPDGGGSRSSGNASGGNSPHEFTQFDERPTQPESRDGTHSGDDSHQREEGSDNRPDSIPPGDIPPPLTRDTPYETASIQPDYLGEQYPGGPMGSPGVEYLDDVGREEYRITIRDGLVYDASGLPFDTRDGVSAFGPNNSGRAIFVMDEHGNLYASTYQAYKEFHHSSLLSGQDVAAAGELIATDGRIELVTDRSGHYMPGRSQTQQFVDQLESQGIVLDSNSIQYFAPPGT